jgi:hypothetical protein
MSSWIKPISVNDIRIKKQKIEENILKTTQMNQLIELKTTQMNQLIKAKNAIPKNTNILDKSDITIILQGIICKDIDIIHTLNDYSRYAKIILSIYEELTDSELLNTIRKDFPNVVIVNNDLKENEEKLSELVFKNITNHTKNIYFQIQLMINALEYVTTTNVVKFRVDHYISDIDKFLEICFNTDKIVTTSYFVRGFNQYKYHLSDCLFGCKTDTMKEIYNLANLNYQINYKLVIPEIILWYPYLCSIIPDIDSIQNAEEYSEILNKYIYIYPINFHSNYKLKVSKSEYKEVEENKIFDNYFIISKFKDRPKTTIDYFINGMDLK